MPEEINRLVTDRLSDLLLTTDDISSKNLIKEGVSEHNIKFVGNIMIDTLEDNRQLAARINIHDILSQNCISKHSFLKGNKFALLTMHRPSNVDQKEILEPIITFICDDVSEDMIVFWPIHPRTQKQLKKFGLWDKIISTEKVIMMQPIGYHDMLRLNMDATIVLTDSGGLQEECTILGTPCLTLRWNTERPITLKENGGASILVGNSIDLIRFNYKKMIKEDRRPQRPELWDGKTAKRCLDAILEFR
jgi:UDP-N-acetylglucosamine 2-epimerase (non-hydrolysing)